MDNKKLVFSSLDEITFRTRRIPPQMIGKAVPVPTWISRLKTPAGRTKNLNRKNQCLFNCWDYSSEA